MAADLSVVNAVVVIQAYVRGFLVRRKLLEVRKEFEEVVKELEQDARLVCWKREGLEMPLITSDPKVLKSTNEKTNLVSKANGDKISLTRNQGLMKKGFGINAEGDILSNTVQDGYNVPELEMEQVDKQMSTEYKGSLLESTLNSERYNGDFQQNQEFLCENEMKSLQRLKQKQKITCPTEQSPGRLEPLRINADHEVMHCDCPDDKCPHKITESSCSACPQSSTLNPASYSEQEMKETGGHDSTSEASLQGYVHRRPYLRDRALLSESWMTDRSFDPVEGDRTIAVADLPVDKVKLRELRDHIGMELLWTEQAIQSRKKYLGLIKGLSHAEPDCDSTVSWD